MLAPVSDRRRSRRYNLSLSIRVGSSGQDPSSWHDGTVWDISNRGIYFVSVSNPEVGSKLHFKIALPAEMIGGKDAVIDGFVRVVRVETHGESIEPRKGVAVTIERFEILTS